VTCWDPLLVSFPFPFFLLFFLNSNFFISWHTFSCKGFPCWSAGAYALRSDPRMTAPERKKEIFSRHQTIDKAGALEFIKALCLLFLSGIAIQITSLVHKLFIKQKFLNFPSECSLHSSWWTQLCLFIYLFIHYNFLCSHQFNKQSGFYNPDTLQL